MADDQEIKGPEFTEVNFDKLVKANKTLKRRDADNCFVIGWECPQR